MAGKPAVLFCGSHNPVSQFEKIAQAVPVVRMDRPHQVAIGGSHQILLCAGHELILKSSPPEAGPDCQGVHVGHPVKGLGFQVHVVPQAVRGVTRKMNDEKGSQTIMLHCLKDDSRIRIYDMGPYIFL